MPRIAADDGVAAIVISKEYQMPRQDRTGTDFGWEPEVLTSNNRGASWTHEDLGGEGSRCVGDYCVVDVHRRHRGRAHLCRLAGEGHHVARARPASAAASPVQSVIGPYLYGSFVPARRSRSRGENVVATWYTGVRPGSWDIDVVGAFSRDHGAVVHR